MSLRVKALSGVKWLSSSTAITVGLNFAQTAALSRLLEPRDFGLTAMIWVFLGFAQMAGDMGMSNAIIQRRDVTDEELSSVYWASVISGLVIGTLMGLSGPALTAYYGEPDLKGLVPWVAASFVVSALGQQFQTLSQRELRFRRLAIGDILAGVAGLGAAVFFAISGAGPYSLVFGGLASSSTRTAWLAGRGWSEWHPRFHLRFDELRNFMRFGLLQLGDRVTNYIWNNVDYMLAGRILGSGPLGIYRLAFETVIRPLGTVNPILNRVAYPVFSKSQDDNAKLRAGVLEMIRLISTLVFPMMAGLCAVAPLAVHVVFGPKWAESAWIIQILSPYGALRSLLNPAALLVVAKGRVEKALYLNLGLAVVLSIGYRIAVPHGLGPMAGTGLILLAIVMVLSWKGLYQSTIDLEVSPYLRAIAAPTLFSIGMGIMVYAAGRILTPLIPVPALRLTALMIVGAAIYSTLLIVFDRPYLNRLRGYLGRIPA